MRWDDTSVLTGSVYQFYPLSIPSSIPPEDFLCTKKVDCAGFLGDDILLSL